MANLKQIFIRQQAERIFHDFLHPEEEEDALRNSLPDSRRKLKLSADVVEEGSQVVVEVELPGVQRHNLSLSVLRDRLIIEGVKDEERPDEVVAVVLPENVTRTGLRPSYLCAERHFGAFERVVQLDAAVDTSRIAARLDRGVLTVTLPKISDRRGKKRRVTID